MSGLQWVRGVDFYEARCGGWHASWAATSGGRSVWVVTSLSEWHTTPEQRQSVEVSGGLWFSPVYLCRHLCLSASCFRSAAPVKNAESDNAKTARIMWRGVIYGWGKKKNWLGLENQCSVLMVTWSTVWKNRTGAIKYILITVNNQSASARWHAFH